MLGTTFNEYDQSIIEELDNTPVAADESIITLSAAATSKGREKMSLYSGKEFIEMFGTADFERFGQVSIQNQRIIEAGGRILFQRLVADDAKLGNAIVVAKLHQTKVQATNSSGQLLYTTEDGEETTESSGNTPVMVATAHIRYEVVTDEDAASVADVKAHAKTLLKAEGQKETVGGDDNVTVYTYPLFYVCDNGRGVSEKRFSIVPEKTLSKNQDFMYYSLVVTEDGKIIESDIIFSMLPNLVVNNERVDLTTAARAGVQVDAGLCDMDAYIEKLAVLSELDVDTIKENDFIFATNTRGIPLDGIVVDEIEGAELNTDIGIELASGDNGTFGDAPYSDPSKKALVEAKQTAFFKGEIDLDIYNTDLYHVNAIFDANFSKDTKAAIAELIEWRKDAMYYRDLGTENKNLTQIRAYIQDMAQSDYIVDYVQAYEVFDATCMSYAYVTIMYDIAPLLTAHLEASPEIPFVGIRNGAIITSVNEKETINFIPKKLPTIDEKSAMEDLKINFAAFFGEQFVIETCYTAKPGKMTQLSFANNRYAVNTVVIALREFFPAVRYQYITSMSDMEAYSARINEFLDQYAGYFSELTFSYDVSKKYLQNKIFKATLQFRFNTFLQSETIDAYMLPTQELQ